MFYNFVTPALDLSATRTVLSADIMSITLSWNEPTGDFDPITSYIIIGCTSSDNGTFLQCPSLGNITTLPSSVTRTTLNVSTMNDYNFDIIAVNMNGQSIPSSIVTIFMRKSIKYILLTIAICTTYVCK